MAPNGNLVWSGLPRPEQLAQHFERFPPDEVDVNNIHRLIDGKVLLKVVLLHKSGRNLNHTAQGDLQRQSGLVWSALGLSKVRPNPPCLEL